MKTFVTTLVLMITTFSVYAQTACSLSSYLGAYVLKATDYPYTSPGSGITVSAVAVGVSTLSNFSYNCNGVAYNTNAPAWWLNNASQNITLTFSQPVTAFSVIVNGSNNTEEFYFSANTGTVSLSDFCTTGFNSINSNTGLRCFSISATSTLITINNPTGSTVYRMTHNGLGSGSRYAVLDCFVPATVLPITLNDFSSLCDNNNVILNWSTSEEINNDFFSIERSNNATDFVEVAQIKGAGNSSNLQTYSWTDENNISETTYYRLKQTDFNGEFSYSNVIANNCSSANILVYPNPILDVFSIKLSEHFEFPAQIDVLNYLGQTVYSENLNTKTKLVKVSLDEGLSSEVYFIKVSNASGQVVKKVFK